MDFEYQIRERVHLPTCAQVIPILRLGSDEVSLFSNAPLDTHRDVRNKKYYNFA